MLRLPYRSVFECRFVRPSVWLSVVRFCVPVRSPFPFIFSRTIVKLSREEVSWCFATSQKASQPWGCKFGSGEAFPPGQQWLNRNESEGRVWCLFSCAFFPSRAVLLRQGLWEQLKYFTIRLIHKECVLPLIMPRPCPAARGPCVSVL